MVTLRIVYGSESSKVLTWLKEFNVILTSLPSEFEIMVMEK